MSGKGADPFVSAWLLERTGEAPGRLIANLLLRGRPDELTDTELQAARVDGLAAYKIRNAAALADRNTLYAQMLAAEAQDATIAAAKAAVKGSGAGAEAALEAYQAAREANQTVMALEAQCRALMAARKPGPAESDLVAVVAEMRRRRVPR
jgi:hypothetical protein